MCQYLRQNSEEIVGLVSLTSAMADRRAIVDVPIPQIMETLVATVEVPSMSRFQRGFVSALLVDCKTDKL